MREQEARQLIVQHDSEPDSELAYWASVSEPLPCDMAGAEWVSATIRGLQNSTRNGLTSWYV